MSADANSVNIKSYHHGSVRADAVSEGLKLLDLKGADQLSLREIARNVGVSATALYRHFPDKAELLKALAAQGFDDLAKRQALAACEGGFSAVGQTYVHFALENPALFRLMFASLPAGAHPTLEPSGNSVSSLLRDGVSALMPDGSRQERFVAMLRAWSLVHGLAMLILDGQVDQSTAEAMIADIVSGDSLNLA